MKYGFALALGIAGIALLMRRKKRATTPAAVNGCDCGCGSYGDIDALPQRQVFVDPLQRYTRAGTR